MMLLMRLNDYAGQHGIRWSVRLSVDPPLRIELDTLFRGFGFFFAVRVLPLPFRGNGLMLAFPRVGLQAMGIRAHVVLLFG